MYKFYNLSYTEKDGGKTMEKIIVGMAIGSVLGAVLVANNAKTRALVQKGQEEAMAKFECYVDQKLAAMNGSESATKADQKQSTSKKN